MEDRCLLSAAGAISGTTFEDLTGNGITADDVTVAGRTVRLFLDDGDGTFEAGHDSLVGQQNTDNTGAYDFRGLAAGTYFVQQELPLDWVQTAPNEIRHDVIIRPADAGQTPAERNDTLATAVATGLSSATPGTYIVAGEIGDNNHRVLDVDLFRVQANAGDVIRVDVDAEAFDSPLDATLRLFDAAGIQLTASTDVGDVSDPYFEFIAKTTGTYYVGVSGHANADYDPAVEGSGNLALSTGEYTLEIDVGPRPGAQPVIITLASGEARTGVDLASSRLGSITGRMFEDLDGDGVQDANEPGLDGWRVSLQHMGGLFSVTTTRSIDLNHDGQIDPAIESGLYSFEDLRPGTYFTQHPHRFWFWAGGLDASFPQPRSVLTVAHRPCVERPRLGPWPRLGARSHREPRQRAVGPVPARQRAVLRPGDAEHRPGADGAARRRGPGQRHSSRQPAHLPGFLADHLLSSARRARSPSTPNTITSTLMNTPLYSLRQSLPDSNGDGIPEVGAVVAGGQKISFCLVDVAPYDLTLPNAAQQPSGFGCGTVQRISVGWEDIYDPLTVGQQIDVSGLALGTVLARSGRGSGQPPARIQRDTTTPAGHWSPLGPAGRMPRSGRTACS